MSASILIVEDDEGLRLAMQSQLQKLHFETFVAGDAEQALQIFEHTHPNLVIADLQLPGASGIELLKRIHVMSPLTLVIVITAFGTIESAVQAMKAGAYDYVIKPLHLAELSALVQCAIRQNSSGDAPQEKSPYTDQAWELEQIIGVSDSLRRILDMAMRVAPTDATVLLLGETGTGKELVARAIHRRSARRSHAFITVSCGSIPKELLESELFGYTKGSFTGAVTPKKGKVEIADGGTLFLDEIGEMPLGLQVRILRLLQEREIEKIGATAPAKVDVRIIAATHRNLEAMVGEGSFREDLYYRLLVVPIQLPPLRERASDIPSLVQHFLQKYKLKYGRSDLTLPPALLPHFTNYQWPGNIRQLENAIERIVLLNPDSEISAGTLPDFLKQGLNVKEIVPVHFPDSGVDVEAVEKQLMIHALEKCDGNQTRAARFLHMSRRAFVYRLKKHGLGKEPQEASHQVAG